MALEFDESATSPQPAAHRRRRRRPPTVRTQQAREAALRRIVAEVSADLELSEVFDDVLDSSRELFGAPIAGLWLLQPGEHMFRLAAQRNLDQELIDEVARVTRHDTVIGAGAIRERRPIVVNDPAAAPRFAGIYRRLGFRTINFVPLLFRDEPVGLLVLYHREPYDWTADELGLATSFANQMATAVANARLYSSVREGAARLRAIGELSSRLNRIQDTTGIGEAIVAEADRLIAHDTIRVYLVDHTTRMCEPIAFQGEFTGIGQPSADMLRLPIGEGLTGWVARHNQSIRLGDAAADPRGRIVGRHPGAESMLVVPMPYESRVLGVIVVSKLGGDAFTDEDQQTLEIFAGYAAQSLANAEAFDQVRRGQQELSHRLESQRRLLEVNERLLSTLDPGGVLEMIADSLKTVVSYDSLTIYRVDRAVGVRRAVVARDRFADLILSHEGAIDVGVTGWAIRNGEAILANDAHVDPRSVQIPGTPVEPESMIV